MIFWSATIGFFVGAAMASYLISVARAEVSHMPDHFRFLAQGKLPEKLLFVLAVAVVFANVMSLNALEFASGGWTLWYWNLLSLLLVSLALSDLIYRFVPLGLVLPLLLLAAVSPALPGASLAWGASVLGAFGLGGMVALLYHFSDGKGIGEADVVLSVVIGLLLGWTKGLVVFAVGNFLGLLVVLPLLIVLGTKRVRQIPLVFFLVAALLGEWYSAYSAELLSFIGML